MPLESEPDAEHDAEPLAAQNTTDYVQKPFYIPKPARCRGFAHLGSLVFVVGLLGHCPREQLALIGELGVYLVLPDEVPKEHRSIFVTRRAAAQILHGQGVIRLDQGMDRLRHGDGVPLPTARGTHHGLRRLVPDLRFFKIAQAGPLRI